LIEPFIVAVVELTPVAAFVVTSGAAGTVLIAIDQPFAIDPVPLVYSSNTNKFHVPFGLVPLKSDNVLPNGLAGAGDGNASLSPEGFRFVGRYVPLVICALESCDAAASSNVKFTLLNRPLPPASDISIVFCPEGPLRRMSKSAGNAWLLVFRPVKLTVTFEIAPISPLIAIVEGYGLAGVAPLGPLVMLMFAELAKVVAVGVGVGAGPMLSKPSTTNSTGRINVFCCPAFIVAICDDTAAISVRVNALTVMLWFVTRPAAALAAAVFPIKVNQLREVIEEIVDAGQQFHFGLEAGSKPELVAALAMHQDPESLIICNGYKDAAFVRIALLGCKLGKKVVIVAEKLEELEQTIRAANVAAGPRARSHHPGDKPVALGVYLSA